MTRGEAAEAALRKVAEMRCALPMAGRPDWYADCREAGRDAMGGTIPEAEQRRWWCPRCVAADALENLPKSGDVGPIP